jgi:quinol monooxygenase YgiN
MEMTGHSYSSGEWLVRPGSEEEFIKAWTNFTEWSLENAEGAESFILVRSMEDPKKFLSLGAWESQQAQEAWREMPQMQVMLGQCRALCDEYDTHRYTLAARPGRSR